jgi:hypothetical protein
MNINIKVISVSKPEFKSKGKAKWQEITVQFDSDKGQQTRKVLSFNKEVYEQAVNMKPGSYYDVEIQKEGDFWNWVRVEEAKAPEGAAPQAARSGSTQTSDRVPDRERQEMIVRQSCIGYALQYVAFHPRLQTTSGILNVASEFETFVHTGEYEWEAPIVDEDDEALKQVEGEATPLNEASRGRGRPRRTAEVD